MKIIALLFSFLMLSQSAFSAERADVCFKNTLPYFQNFSKITASAKDKSQMMIDGCNELTQANMYQQQSFWSSAMYEFANKFGFGLIGHAFSAFDMMKGSARQKVFMAQLEKIKQIQNPMDRIRLVYELVVQAQGTYDSKYYGSRAWLSGGLIFAETPSNLLNNADEYGSVGICREMATLLQWSLLQVSRAADSKDAALGPHDFSSNFIIKTLPAFEHAWVRVHLPQFDERGRLLGFNTFDLDTNLFPNFSPLFPRLSGLSEEHREEAVGQCHQILSCLKAE